MILFGGIAGAGAAALNLNDVWWLNNTGATALFWTKPQITGTKPRPRSGAAAVYDPGSNRMIVFGGALGFASPCANDVWALANANGVGGTPTWMQLSPAGGPPAPRTRLAAVYDQSTNTMIIYGGNSCFSTNYGDVWTLTNANGTGGTPTWTQLSPTGVAPEAREDTSAVYDSTNNLMILYGGSGAEYDPNVWVLTNANGTGGTPAWIQLSISGTLPSARCCNSEVYDPTNNIMTVFGGQDADGNALNDTWVLSNANGLGSSAWTQLSPTLTTGPDPRTFHTAVYNSSTNKMTVFGGYGTAATATGVPALGVYLEDVWVLDDANGQ